MTIETGHHAPTLAIACLLVVVLLAPAMAQDVMQLPPIQDSPAPPAWAEDQTLHLPKITASPPENETKETAKKIQRLNQQLKRKVDEVNPTINMPPFDARSPDTKIGVINIPAVQQQYGKNFGISAVPYRPPSVTYSAPLGRR